MRPPHPSRFGRLLGVVDRWMSTPVLAVVTAVAALAFTAAGAGAAVTTVVTTFPIGTGATPPTLELAAGPGERYAVLQLGAGGSGTLLVGRAGAPPVQAEGVATGVIGPLHFGSDARLRPVITYARIVDGQRDLFAWDVDTQTEYPLTRINGTKTSELEAAMERGEIAFTRRRGQASRTLLFRTPRGIERQLSLHGGSQLVLEGPRVLQVRQVQGKRKDRASWIVEQVSTKRRVSERYRQPYETGAERIDALAFTRSGIQLMATTRRGASLVRMNPFSDFTFGVLPRPVDALAFAGPNVAYALARGVAPGGDPAAVSVVRWTDLDLTRRNRTEVPPR